MEEILGRIRKTIGQGLPGFAVQEKMTPLGRLPADKAILMAGKEPYNGAVMALLNPLPGGTWSLVYIKRPDYDGTHGGQMAFPGGKTDNDDSDFLHTAQRETHEEIGVLPHEYELVGKLTEVYIPPSNFLVHPYISVAKKTLHFTPDDREVEYVWQVLVEWLLSDNAVSVRDFKTVYGTIKNYPCYIFGNHIVWGATAMITAEIVAVLKKSGL